MPLALLPPQLAGRLNEFVTIVTGTVTDDYTGLPVTGLAIRWEIVSDLGLKTDSPFTGLTDSTGTYWVRLSTYHAIGSFTPVVDRYAITLGSGTVVTVASTPETVTTVIQHLRILKVPGTPSVVASGSIEGAHTSGKWTLSPLLLVQPFFDAITYAASTTVSEEPTDVNEAAGRGTHARYLWGTHDWTAVDVQGSGLPYEGLSGVLSLDLEIYAVADSNRETEVFPSGLRYLTLATEASGVTGSTFSPLARYVVPYDAGDPPFPDFHSASGSITSLDVVMSGVLDPGSLDDVTYRVIDTTTNVTSSFASGTFSHEGGLAENTAYTLAAQARDAAGNLSDRGPSSQVVRCSTSGPRLFWTREPTLPILRS